MDDLEAATLASMAGNAANGLAHELANVNLSAITEEDELKLLNFPPSKHEDLSTAIPLTVIFALLLVTGCIGNMCTAIVIARPKNRYMHTATNYYLFSLAMSDFLFLILGLPQEMFTLWQRYPYAFGELFCIIRGYLSEATTYASILTISAFTIERYVAICHPLWAHTMSQLPRAITSIVIIWLLAAICAIPPAAELGIVTQKGPITHRTLEQSAQCATKRTIYENMFVVSAIVFFIVPMIIVTVLYILIAIELRRSSKMNNAITKQSSSSHSGSQQNSNNHSHQKLLGGQLYPRNCAHHHRQEQLCAQGTHRGLRGHLRRASRSQQQIASGTTGLFVDPPVSNGNEQATAASNNGKDQESLMANIMSRRPSSAIGTEHPSSGRLAGHEGLQQAQLPESGLCLSPFQGAKAKQRGHLSNFWPLFWPTTNPATAPGSPLNGGGATACQAFCHCTGQRQNQSNLFQSSQALAESPDPSLAGTIRSHTPLSYHESLIHRSSAGPQQQQQQQLAASKNPETAHSQQLLQTHQMSLQHSPTYQANSIRKSASQHACHCQHYYQQQQQQPQPHHYHGSGNRRSAAASSKKSVIRMLVAVVVSFFICWVPFHAQRLLASYLAKDENQNQFLLDLYARITHISGVLYYLSSTINPLLYQLMSAKFRLAFKETFKCSLFKCFRQQTNRSPANSLKENHQHHQHHQHHHHHHHQHNNNQQQQHLNHHHHQHASICSSQSHYCTASGHWFPLKSQPFPQSMSSQAVKLESGGLFGTCACHPPASTANIDCTSSPDAKQEAEQQQQWRNHQAPDMATPIGLISRLRGRMSTTLVGLFRLNGIHQKGAGSAECANCCCCCSMADRSSSVMANQPTGGGQRRFIYNQLLSATGNETSSDNARDLMGSNSLRVEVTRCCNGSADTMNRAAAAAGSCASSPLLGQPAAAAPVDYGNPLQELVGGAPPGFAAHTMLKFIRNTSPATNAGQQIALSRLSSREEEEEESDNDISSDEARDRKKTTTTTRRPSSGRPRNSYNNENDNTGRNDVCMNDDNNNNNNNSNNGDRALKRSPEHIHALVDNEQMVSLIKATNNADELDEAGCELMQVQSLGLTSESGNSSGSSPDQKLRLTGAPRPRWIPTSKVARSESNKAGQVNPSSPSAGRTRRRSLQQAKPNKHHKYTGKHSVDNGRMAELAPAASLSEKYCIDQRRESSSSSTTTNNKHQISSSLSSSDRQLDKKLSFSTTTSAIDDCGSSFTTTNSQLTGSHPTLAQNRDLIMSHNVSSERIDNDNDNDDDDGEEEEESTVINLHCSKDERNFGRVGGNNDEDHHLLTSGNEIKLPLLGGSSIR